MQRIKTKEEERTNQIFNRAMDIYQKLIDSEQPHDVIEKAIRECMVSEGYAISDRLLKQLIKKWRRTGEVVTKEQMSDTYVDLTEAHSFLNNIISAMEKDLSLAEESDLPTSLRLKEMVYSRAYKYLDIKLRLESMRSRKDGGEEVIAFNRINFND